MSHQESAREPWSWYLAWTAAALFAALGLWISAQVGLGYDSHAYWSATRSMGDLYGARAFDRDAFLYSPLFAQVIWPLGLLPWPVFGAVWALLIAATFTWLLKPLPRKWIAPALLAVTPEIATGNIEAFMAVALVLGTRPSRWSGLSWSFLGLTKVLPGFIGVLWLSIRREWGVAARALVGTLVLVLTSVIISPSQWSSWIHFLIYGVGENGSHFPRGAGLTLAMLAGAVILISLAAALRRPFLLAPAAILLSPTFGPNTLTLLAALPRLLQTIGGAESSGSGHAEQTSLCAEGGGPSVS